ncbi:MAG: methylmalonyl-CoA mutase, partial [Flavobacterium sp.]
MTENNPLFSEFAPVSSKQWKQQIQFELKGADYNETLVWESPEGIKVRPFYHRDEFAPAALSDNEKAFSICQDIFVFDLEKSAHRANDSVKRGAESIRFIVEDETIDVDKLLSGLPLENIAIFFDVDFLSPDFTAKVNKIAKDKNARIYCLVDPVGHLAKDGNWIPKSGDNFADLKSISAASEHIGTISADGSLYQNAGANIVQQIAYTLAHANEYFDKIENINKPMVLQMAVGTNYFFEIAKLRAVRSLYNLIAKEYGITAGCHILATPSKRNKTLYDYNVNMLRTTTECMSAVLGGADTVANLPYDAIYHKSNEFGERISRNQLLILKHESYFDKVLNAAD